MNNILETDVNKAILEIKTFLKVQSNKCAFKGWRFYLDNDAPESFKALKEHKASKMLPIATAGSNTSIYGTKFNTLFRFYHDVTHLKLDKGFSLEGELAVIDKHIKDIKESGLLSPLAIQIFLIDTKGQVEYYFHHKSFVKNQRTFLDTALRYGIKRAIQYLKP
mgnify:CR=1 FL=1